MPRLRRQSGKREGFCVFSTGSPAGAEIEQQLPFGSLDFKRCALQFRAAMIAGILTDVYESKRVPCFREFQARALMGRRNASGSLKQLRKNRMLTHLLIPVRGVARIRLLAVHDGVPIAALGGFNGLRRLVGVLPAREIQI